MSFIQTGLVLHGKVMWSNVGITVSVSVGIQSSLNSSHIMLYSERVTFIGEGGDCQLELMQALFRQDF